jgi:hypothetical protein
VQFKSLEAISDKVAGYKLYNEIFNETNEECARGDSKKKSIFIKHFFLTYVLQKIVDFA